MAETARKQTEELVRLDPRSLAAHPANIRDSLGDADLAELAASVAERGVLEPLVVVPDGQGHRIVAGHRRNAAAIQAGLELVPCVVRTDLAGQADQLITTLVENTQRRDLSTAEEARGYHQLALAGLSAAKIAKATGAKSARVRQALQVAGSEMAARATARFDLTLDQGAALIEFDQDPEAIKLLVATAKQEPSRWDHVVARLRADR